ncbi:uncharacterized protein LOC129744269 [Uranotaenia lowii]|uniref:uncharacterized protein LOC129744269 n=1 Tax=Uranotaenia lowii TaxID=190385 RepID=UPI00247ADC7D|nr:uncharacterized protein LOC129744269 [Uranotaenia lowii]
MDGAPPGGGGPTIYVDSSPIPPYMRSSNFDGRKIFLKVQRPGENPTPLPKNPFWFSSFVEAKIGKPLRKEIDMAIDGKGLSYTLSTYNTKLAEELKKIKELDTNTAIEIIDHPGLNKTLGIAYLQEATDISEEEILKELKSQGVTAVRKITKYIEKKQVNTPMMVLTFGSTKLPKEVYFGWIKVSIRTYYESPMFCKNCLNYRHTKKRCDQTTRCTRCAGNHPNTENSCKEVFRCPHCPDGKNEHSAAGRKCPLYRHEEAVIRCKTDESISWAEARKRVGPFNAKPTYASVTDADSANKDKIIESLLENVQKMTATIEQLTKENRKMALDHKIFKEKVQNYFRENNLSTTLTTPTRDRSQSASRSGNTSTTNQQQQLQLQQKLQHEQQQEEENSTFQTPKPFTRQSRKNQANSTAQTSSTAKPTDKKNGKRGPQSPLAEKAAYKNLKQSKNHEDSAEEVQLSSEEETEDENATTEKGKFFRN